VEKIVSFFNAVDRDQDKKLSVKELSAVFHSFRRIRRKNCSDKDWKALKDLKAKIALMKN